MLQFTLPHYHYRPTHFAEIALDPAIPVHICTEFLLPKSGICRGGRGEATIFVTVPEAAVDENDLAARREDQIGLAGKVFGVQTEAVTHPVDEAANRKFRPCVSRPHRSHDAGAPRGIDVIGHID